MEKEEVKRWTITCFFCKGLELHREPKEHTAYHNTKRARLE